MDGDRGDQQLDGDRGDQQLPKTFKILKNTVEVYPPKWITKMLKIYPRISIKLIKNKIKQILNSKGYLLIPPKLVKMIKNLLICPKLIKMIKNKLKKGPWISSISKNFGI